MLKNAGFSLIEMLVVVAITAIVGLSLLRVIASALEARDYSSQRNELIIEAEFALNRIVNAVSRSPRLILPLRENPVTVYSEAIRDPGVLAVTLDPTADRNNDGTPDADNDLDGLIDEDASGDANNDGESGIRGIDDNNDGNIDNENVVDDDESGDLDEDLMDAIDTDGDGTIDEDPPGNMNGDGAPGIAGVDDDGDGLTDEGGAADDDEDGTNNEDWWDTTVFFLQGSNLIERTPVPWDVSGDALVTGEDYIESTIVENVSRFRVERLSPSQSRGDLLDITLELTGPDGGTVSLTTQVRIGERL